MLRISINRPCDQTVRSCRWDDGRCERESWRAGHDHCCLVADSVKVHIITHITTAYFSLHFNGHFSRWTWISQYYWSWWWRRWWVVTTGAIRRAKLQSNHHQQTNTQLFTGRMPFLSPNQHCHSTEGKNITIHGPKLTWGSSKFVFDHKRLLITLGEGCHASRQPSDAKKPNFRPIYRRFFKNYFQSGEVF